VHLKHKKTNKKLVLTKTNIKPQNPGLVAVCSIRPEMEQAYSYNPRARRSPYITNNAKAQPV